VEKFCSPRPHVFHPGKSATLNIAPACTALLGSSREVTGIDGDVRLNCALGTLTERMAGLKGAA
jgi:hypothetical protein